MGCLYLYMCVYVCVTQPGWPSAPVPQGQSTLSRLVWPLYSSVLDVQNLWCEVPIWFTCMLLPIASSICEWLIHELLIPVSIITMWAGMKHNFREILGHTQGQLIGGLGYWCTKGTVFILLRMFLRSFICMFLQSVCSSRNSKCIVWAERNRMGGFVRAGAHMLVNLQAGNCTGIDTQTHTLPTIYTQFVTQAPSAAEAILPPHTSLDPAPLLTLSSVLYKMHLCHTTKPSNYYHSPPRHSKQHSFNMLLLCSWLHFN